MSYRVQMAEAAEGEAEAAYFWMLRRSPEAAARWYSGLLSAVGSLASLPYRCPLARENAQFETEVRQLLYGRGRNVYRVLFTVDEANPDGPVVRVLHIRHGARRALGE